MQILAGQRFATAIMPWGKPGPIRLPASQIELEILVRAHVFGLSAVVESATLDGKFEHIRVLPVVLGAYCPDSEQNCRWLAFDFDSADGHGAKGLRDPAHAMCCFTERVAGAGLFSGLVAAHSKSGLGRHVWILLPGATALEDAVIAAAALAARSYKIAASDNVETCCPNAFHNPSGQQVDPGESGAFEIVPRSTTAPARGCSMTLPAAGAFLQTGGGVIIDPFSGEPRIIDCEVRCDPNAWQNLVDEARVEFAKRRPPSHANIAPRRNSSSFHRLDPRTREFLDGATPAGQRNNATYVAVLNMLGCGMNHNEISRLVLDAGVRCGLSLRETQAAMNSAIKRWELEK